MTLDKQEIISAQVILRAASGKAHEDMPITSATLGEAAPPARAVAQAQRYFRERGFEVGEWVGISFSVSGPVTLFEAVFAVHLSWSDDEGIQAMREDGTQDYELPAEGLPPALGVEAVTFTPPPEFGPTSFF